MRIFESQASKNMARNIPMRYEYSLETKPADKPSEMVRNYRETGEPTIQDKTLDTQVSKFYKKFGENWKEMFYRNQEAEI